MDEYISRKAAINAIEAVPNGNWKSIRYAREISAIPAADVVPVVSRDLLMEKLSKYFSIGDSYTYELTRVKEAFEIGTMKLDDFSEWGEDNISDLCDYLMREIFNKTQEADNANNT